jgi:hypothetical protein
MHILVAQREREPVHPFTDKSNRLEAPLAVVASSVLDHKCIRQGTP